MQLSSKSLPVHHLQPVRPVNRLRRHMITCRPPHPRFTRRAHVWLVLLPILNDDDDGCLPASLAEMITTTAYEVNGKWHGVLENGRTVTGLDLASISILRCDGDVN